MNILKRHEHRGFMCFYAAIHHKKKMFTFRDKIYMKKKVGQGYCCYLQAE